MEDGALLVNEHKEPTFKRGKTLDTISMNPRWSNTQRRVGRSSFSPEVNEIKTLTQVAQPPELILT